MPSHYHSGTAWRMPYHEQPDHKQFRTYIYAFTWEDPEEDLRHGPHFRCLSLGYH
ncbi:hypothetical protein DFH09DRAFT_1119480 [Mycena vulgaris]|nr:hypothetical protein DFH09DRAFT_1119480 [Mycena vulgaris]